MTRRREHNDCLFLHMIKDDDEVLLSCFDTDLALYMNLLMLKGEPHIAGLIIPTFATLSSETCRYEKRMNNKLITRS